MVMFDNTAQIILAENTAEFVVCCTQPPFLPSKRFGILCVKQDTQNKCLLFPSSPELQHLSDADYTTPSFSKMLREDSLQPCLFSLLTLS